MIKKNPQMSEFWCHDPGSKMKLQCKLADTVNEILK